MWFSKCRIEKRFKWKGQNVKSPAAHGCSPRLQSWNKMEERQKKLKYIIPPQKSNYQIRQPKPQSQQELHQYNIEVDLFPSYHLLK